MENYDDERRRQTNDDRYRSQHDREERDRDRDLRWSHDADRPRRAERGWLDYDRDYGRSHERDRDERRYAESARERPRFSPDWSREDAEPRYSDEPYYARNRERTGSDEEWRRSPSRQTEEQRRWDQRARASLPHEQRDDDQGSHYRGYYRRATTPVSYPGGSGYLYSESWTLHGPYSGRGPKGYKRSDQQIIEDACQRLERDGEVDASEIEVTAEDGVIRLRGTVPDRATKRRAEQCVESVYGACDVMNELRVQRDSQASQSAFGAQGSQASQAGQAGRGGTPSQSSATSTRGTGTASQPEQTPKH